MKDLMEYTTLLQKAGVLSQQQSDGIRRIISLERTRDKEREEQEIVAQWNEEESNRQIQAAYAKFGRKETVSEDTRGR